MFLAFCCIAQGSKMPKSLSLSLSYGLLPCAVLFWAVSTLARSSRIHTGTFDFLSLSISESYFHLHRLDISSNFYTSFFFNVPRLGGQLRFPGWCAFFKPFVHRKCVRGAAFLSSSFEWWWFLLLAPFGWCCAPLEVLP